MVKSGKMTVAEQVKDIVQETVLKLEKLAKQQRMDTGFILWLGHQALKTELTTYETIQKTRLQDFIGRYPNAKTDCGIPYVCPCELNKKWKPKENDCYITNDRELCRKCWNMPVDTENADKK